MATRDAPELVVLIKNRKQDNARVLLVSQSLGGQVPDSATFRIEPTRRSAITNKGGPSESLIEGRRLVDMFDNKECTIVVKPRTGGNQIVHWGKIVGGEIQLDGDVVTFTSRMDDHLFGDPYVLTEEKVYPSATFKAIKIDVAHPIFNPLMDGRVVPNMWKLDMPAKKSVFLSPDTIPKRAHDPLDPFPAWPELQPWTLTDTALYLIWTLNPTQEYIKNPTRVEVEKVLGTDQSLVRHHEIRIGQRLPALLDDLLERYGFSFCVNYRGAYRYLTFVNRDGDDNPITLKRQLWPNIFDPSRSEVMDAKLRVDHVNRACNAIDVLGDFEVYESTFELFPAWHHTLDETDTEDLILDSPAMKADPRLYRVWRDWVLGEGGDYKDTRFGGRSGAVWVPFVKKPYDFSTLFGTTNYVTHRRRFEPTLTISPNDDGVAYGSWDGVYVEWWDGQYYQPVSLLSNQAVQVLVDECGIRFTNPASPPDEIVRMGIDNARIRVTASVRSDRRIRGSVKRFGVATKITNERKQIVEVGNEYVLRQIATTSQFYDKVNTTKELRSEQQDDTTAIKDRADALFKSWHHSSITGPITVDGIDWGRNVLGRGVRDIQPAGIQLLAAGALASAPKYPVVSQVIYDVQQQQTTVNLETFRRLHVG